MNQRKNGTYKCLNTSYFYCIIPKNIFITPVYIVPSTYMLLRYDLPSGFTYLQLGRNVIINWWKGKPSGSIACTRKQQPRFYWSCSSVVINDVTPLTPKPFFKNICHFKTIHRTTFLSFWIFVFLNKIEIFRFIHI